MRRSLPSATIHPNMQKTRCTLFAILAIIAIVVCSPNYIADVHGQSSSSSSSSTGAAASSNYLLNLVFTTDVRGRMLPIDATQADCPPSTVVSKPTTCYGGVARRATFIKQSKANYTNTLALDVGNYYYGTSFLVVANPPGANIARWVSQSGYDIIGMGTNEFFNGPGTLGGYLSALQPPSPVAVCSNLDVSKEPLLANSGILPYFVQNLNGRNIGFLGAISAALSTSSSPGPNVIVNNGTSTTGSPNPQLTAALNAMKAAHPDLNIVVLVCALVSHSSVVDIANGVADVDIILYKSNDQTDLKFEVITSLLTQKSVVLATIPLVGGPAGFGGTIGNIQVNFDPSGAFITPVTGGTVLLDSTYPDDPAIWSSVQSEYTKVVALNGAVVGQLHEDLGETVVNPNNTLIWCRASDCNVGRLVTDAMLYWCKDCDLAHTNGGGLRSNLYMSQSTTAPNVTRGDIAKILPFGNNFVSYSILGKDFLQTMLTVSLSKYKTGGWHQYSNVRWAYNPAATSSNPYGTVAYVSILDRASGTWKAMDPAKTYKIATLNYVLGPPGGDGYAIGPTYGVNLYGPPAVDAVDAWMSSNQFTEPPTLQELLFCGINVTYTLKDELGNGNITWPYDQCNVIRTDEIVNLADKCPTSYDLCAAGGLAYDGKEFNTSNCNACSGLGTCISGYRRCACDRPVTTGLFAGMTMIEGSDCSYIRTEYAISNGLRGFLYFLSAVSILLTLGSSLFFYIYRDAKVVKRSAFLFLQIACFGGLLGAGSCLSMIATTSNVTCQVSNWLGNMGWVLMFGSLFVKTWRIFAIFGNKRLKTVVLTDKDMLGRFAFILLVEILLRVIESSISAPAKSAQQIGNCAPVQNLQDLLDGNTNTGPPSDFLYFFTCDSRYFNQIDVANWVYKACFTIWGCSLAYSIKDIQEDFNESKLLALVIYNMTVFAILAKVIILFVGSKNPSLTLAVEVLAINYVVICTVLGLSVPKYLMIRGGVAGAASVSRTGLGKDGAQGSTLDAQRGGTTAGRSAYGGGDDETTQNVTMNPGGSGKITQEGFSKSLDSIRNRMRTSAADRTNELAGFIDQATKFVDQLTALKNSSASAASGNSFAGRPGAVSVSRAPALSVARALAPSNAARIDQPSNSGLGNRSTSIGRPSVPVTSTSSTGSKDIELGTFASPSGKSRIDSIAEASIPEEKSTVPESSAPIAEDAPVLETNEQQQSSSKSPSLNAVPEADPSSGAGEHHDIEIPEVDPLPPPESEYEPSISQQKPPIADYPF